MTYYIYVLLSLKDKQFYVGYSKNLKQRVSQHKYGDVRSTKGRRPLELIYYECFSDEEDAKAREVFLKVGLVETNFEKH